MGEEPEECGLVRDEAAREGAGLGRGQQLGQPEAAGDRGAKRSALGPQPEKWTFSKIAQHASSLLGKSGAFAAACGIILLWAAVGPFFGYSDTWQLIVNTGTTIVTFLMVFLVQNTQNRDARALHLKLDELLRSVKPARNKLIDLENCSDEEIEDMARQFQALRQRERRTSKGDPGAKRARD
jgi:low affinity Fe/Cu permease